MRLVQLLLAVIICILFPPALWVIVPIAIFVVVSIGIAGEVESARIRKEKKGKLNEQRKNHRRLVDDHKRKFINDFPDMARGFDRKNTKVTLSFLAVGVVSLSLPFIADQFFQRNLITLDTVNLIPLVSFGLIAVFMIAWNETMSRLYVNQDVLSYHALDIDIMTVVFQQDWTGRSNAHLLLYWEIKNPIDARAYRKKRWLVHGFFIGIWVLIGFVAVVAALLPELSAEFRGLSFVAAVLVPPVTLLIWPVLIELERSNQVQDIERSKHKQSNRPS